MNTRILAPVVAVLAIGGAATLAGDNDLIPTANAGSFELSVGQLKINQRISAAAVRRANKNRADIAALQQGPGIPGAPASNAGASPTEGGGGPATTGGSPVSSSEVETGELGDEGSAPAAPASPLRAVFSTRKVMSESTFGPIASATNTTRTLVASCPRGYDLVGGGHSVGARVTGDPLVRVSAPVDASSNSWKVSVQRSGVPFVGGSAQQTRGLRAWAVCAKVTNVVPIVDAR